MTVTLELKPEVETQLAAQAAQRGLPVEAFLESLIENGLQQSQSFYQTSSDVEWERALDELGEFEVRNRPTTVDDSRESIYREREDSQL